MMACIPWWIFLLPVACWGNKRVAGDADSCSFRVEVRQEIWEASKHFLWSYFQCFYNLLWGKERGKKSLCIWVTKRIDRVFSSAASTLDWWVAGRNIMAPCSNKSSCFLMDTAHCNLETWQGGSPSVTSSKGCGFSENISEWTWLE